MSAIAPLFEGWPETMIWSCLQGRMGSAYGDHPDRPEAGLILLGDLGFLAGTPNRELAGYKPPGCRSSFAILAPRHSGWHPVIEEVYGERARPWTRYATKKEGDRFDRAALREIVAGLPKPYRLFPIDREIYHRLGALDWARDLRGQFADYRDYSQGGLGVVIQREGVILSGASAYSAYREGIEVEIDTRADHRRRGLALVCGGALILACLERNLYPSWDAHNKGSLALAEKLGYRFDRAYPVYEVTDY